ncbi:MAG: DUF1553 domain-containing protein [Planctomycetota bacterium]
MSRFPNADRSLWWLTNACAILGLVVNALGARADEDPFLAAARVLENRCVSCHAGTKANGKLGCESLARMTQGGESGPAIVPGKPEESLLLEYVTGTNPEMPKNGPPLSADEVMALTTWIRAGAPWPDGKVLEDRDVPDAQWWSFRPLVRPAVPTTSSTSDIIANPIDAFIVAKLNEKGLPQSPAADRRTLIRRLSFDLTGLPPTPEEIEAYITDPDSDAIAYRRVVDRLLESPRYGERWARHWLDVVHFGETHGYDKDKPRPNAWPYRDYVIRSLNDDKPYRRFIEEQLAGDIFYPGSVDGIEALGFIAAGPWDFIGHAEVPESKIDGKVARHLDRDDMVATTMGTFTSVTVGCAQCHNHKFDPISQREYYQLQAVFAAVDRSDKSYDSDPSIAAQRSELERKLAEIAARQKQIDAKMTELGGPELVAIDQRIAEATQLANKTELPEFGFHSNIEPREDAIKWVQVDLGQSQRIEKIEFVACNDPFNHIGPGFGFPVRFKIEASDDPDFQAGVALLLDRTSEDVPNPGVVPQRVDGISSHTEIRARYVRFTATKLVHRLPTDFIFALGELAVLSSDGQNLARGANVTSLDSIEAAPRWQRANLVDGYYYGRASAGTTDRVALQADRETLLRSRVDPETLADFERVKAQLAQAQSAKNALPPPKLVYAGMIHYGSGAFLGTGGNGGKPRPIYVLDRGNVTQPKDEVTPGALTCLSDLNPWFDLPADHSEGDRRAALARWIADDRNPLTWRSIVNRVWQHHFGRGLVDTPNDLGRMGAQPTHPELLDWLAVEFRDRGQSLKRLHKLIVTSHTYRQISSDSRSARDENPQAVDADNRYLWRANRRRLEAEAVRDVVLQVSGKLDLKMGGPSFQDFVIEQPDHSPHYEYHLHNPDDPQSHRRSIYRFLVRSQPQPFMTTLDCADPSMRVDKRNESLSPLQALALLNNGLMVTMSHHFAERLENECSHRSGQVQRLFELALGRTPTPEEQSALETHIQKHGLANACRLILNLNEFTFVD